MVPGSFALTGRDVGFGIGLLARGFELELGLGGAVVYGQIIPDQDPDFSDVTPDQSSTYTEITNSDGDNWQLVTKRNTRILLST